MCNDGLTGVRASLHRSPLSESPVGAEWLHFLLLLLRTGRLPAATLERHVLQWALSRGEVRFIMANSWSIHGQFMVNWW